MEDFLLRPPNLQPRDQFDQSIHPAAVSAHLRRQDAAHYDGDYRPRHLVDHYHHAPWPSAVPARRLVLGSRGLSGPLLLSLSARLVFQCGSQHLERYCHLYVAHPGALEAADAQKPAHFAHWHLWVWSLVSTHSLDIISVAGTYYAHAASAPSP